MKYEVWLNGMTQKVKIEADDVSLDGDGDMAYWNFIAEDMDGDTVTAAAFPFAKVDYIVATEIP